MYCDTVSTIIQNEIHTEAMFAALISQLAHPCRNKKKHY